MVARRDHALNLKDSGCKNITVALRKGSATAKKAEADGLKVMSVPEVSIGHCIIADALNFGMSGAVERYRTACGDPV